MATTVLFAAVSLDGYIAQPDDGVAELFDFYGAGDVEVAPGDPERTFRLDRTSADWVTEVFSSVRATVVGRHLFDYTNGWDGRPPAGDHVVVVTHRAPTDWPFPDAPFTFVTDGVVAAVERARALAGDGYVSVAAGDVGGQALAAGVIDEVELALVPVVFGRGKRFFGDYAGPHLLLDDPHVTIAGRRVTHLRYRVRRPA
jgi:dihydrofolate reductase